MRRPRLRLLRRKLTRILGNCDAAMMSSLAEPGKVTNFPSHLTPSIIRNHFPIGCPDCPMGNLQRRPSQYSDLSSSSIGGEFEVDYKGKWTNADGRSAPTFKKELYSFTAVDTSSIYIFTRLCPNCLAVIDHLESLRLFAVSSGKTLTVIRTDNEFLTSSAIHWAREHNVKFKVSIPFEHDNVKVVERTHRTLQEMTVKCLAFKPHLSPAYWGMAYEHCALLHNMDILST